MAIAEPPVRPTDAIDMTTESISVSVNHILKLAELLHDEPPRADRKVVAAEIRELRRSLVSLEFDLLDEEALARGDAC